MYSRCALEDCFRRARLFYCVTDTILAFQIALLTSRLRRRRLGKPHAPIKSQRYATRIVDPQAAN